MEKFMHMLSILGFTAWSFKVNDVNDGIIALGFAIVLMDTYYLKFRK